MEKNGKGVSMWVTFFLLVGSVALMLFTSTAYWYLNYVANRSQFVSNVQTVFRQQDVRNALSSKIVDVGLARFPIIKNLVEDTVQPAIAGILGSPRLQPVIGEVAGSFYDNMMSKEPHDVAINIQPLQRVIALLATLVNEGGETPIADSIPTRIVILPASQIPSLYSTTVFLTTFAPIAGLASLIILGCALYFTSRRLLALQHFGMLLGIGGLFGYLLVPYLGSVQMSMIPDQYIKVIYANFYVIFTTDLQTNFAYICSAGVLLFTVVLLWRIFGPKIAALTASSKGKK